ncbi:aldehyde dehydrogenase family protein, partial [Streptomyces sp. Agncl-13]|uniref:aldehyde dehydrogenase family protein n=1 Tax=Streptomyces sp. Agncl-13 TaxID=3400628 RepID=UPI003A8596A6
MAAGGRTGGPGSGRRVRVRLDGARRHGGGGGRRQRLADRPGLPEADPATALPDVKPDMQAAREEIFGPVLVALPFDTEDEAVTL